MSVQIDVRKVKKGREWGMNGNAVAGWQPKLTALAFSLCPAERSPLGDFVDVRATEHSKKRHILIMSYIHEEYSKSVL
jgi:hypothetical protein